MNAFKPCSDKHITRTSQANVAEICRPLFAQLNLNYFHYGRFYKDGSLTVLYSRIDWHDCFYTSNFQTAVPLPKQPIQFGQYNVCLWQGTLSDTVTHAARNLCDLDHPINITIAQKDYFESFAFGTHAGNDTAINTYFNNIETLFQFTHSFKEQAATLIEQADTAKFILPPSSQANELKILDNLSAALTLRGNQGDIKITLKEMEILKLLCTGLTLQETATALKRSARTIEMHVNHLKTKLGCKKKSQLIAVALKNNILV